MKRIILAVVAVLMFSSSAFAEATFAEVQELIKDKDYVAAAAGMEVILQNHKTSKAYYTMAQAQAGLGNQAMANEYLAKARGINPKLKFVPAANVAKLREAIQPQTNKIVAVESHTGRNVMIFLFLAACIGLYFLFRRKNEGPRRISDDYPRGPVLPNGPRPLEHQTAMKAQLELTAQNSGNPALRAFNVGGTVPHQYGPREPREQATYANMRSTRSETERQQPVEVHHHTTVVQNNSNDMLTGMAIGSMMSHDHGRSERVIEREYVQVERESAPVRESAPSRSSWDEPRESAPAPSRSSSWDDSPAPSSSPSSSSQSSWDDSPSSSSDSGSSWPDD